MKFKKRAQSLVSVLLMSTMLVSALGSTSFAAAPNPGGLNSGTVPTALSNPEDSTSRAAELAKGQSAPDNPVPLGLVLDTPVDTTLVQGEDQPIHLKQLYSDGSTVDVSPYTSWVSRDETIANVTNGSSSVLHAVNPGDTVITATYNNEPPVSFFTMVNKAVLPNETAGIILSTNGISLFVDESYGVEAQRINLNDEKGDITQKGEWSSEDESIATVNEYGVITAHKLGTTYIRFSYEGLTDMVLVNVVEPVGLVFNATHIEVMPNDGTDVAVFENRSNGSSVNVTEYAEWSVKDPEIAEVSMGTIHGLKTGTTLVTASYDSFSVDIPVKVTDNLTTPTVLALDITEPQYKLKFGETSTPMTVKAIYSDGTIKDVTDDPELNWMASNGLVNIKNHSIVTYGSGAALLMATYENRLAFVPVFVEQDPNAPPVETHIFTSLEVTPEVSALALNETKNVHTEAIFNYGLEPGKNRDVTETAVYKSSNPGIVSVSPSGELKGLQEGTAEITVYAYSLTKHLHITVSGGGNPYPPRMENQEISALEPSNSKVEVDVAASKALSASAIFKDGSSKDVTSTSTWTSLNTNVLTVEAGLLKPVAPGHTQVLVHQKQSTALVDVTVKAAGAGTSVVETTEVGTDDIDTGDVGIDLPGSEGYGQLKSFYLSASELAVQEGDLVPVRVQAAFTDGDDSNNPGEYSNYDALIDITELTQDTVTGSVYTTWTSQDSDIATVSKGKIIGVHEGTTVITVQYDHYPALEIPVTVQTEMGSVKLVGAWLDPQQTKPRLMPGEYYPAPVANAQYSNFITFNANDYGQWHSDNPAVATVDSHGNITAHELGEAYVWFVYDSPQLESPLQDNVWVRVGPPDAMITWGEQDITLARQSAYSTHDIYLVYGRDQEEFDGGEWVSADDSVATVTDYGQIIAQNPGQTTVTLSYRGFTLDYTVTVLDQYPDKPVLSLYSNPGYVIETQDKLIKPTIYAMYIDGTIADVTSSVEWLESSPAVAQIKQNQIYTGQQGAAVIAANYQNTQVIIPIVVKGSSTGTPGQGPGSGTGPAPAPASPSTAPAAPEAPASEQPSAASLSLIDAVDQAALKAKLKQALADQTPVTYTDVKGTAWSAKGITLASRLGFVKGYTDGSFHPQADITRAEFAVMLARALGLSGSSNASFSDVKSSSFAADAISTLQALGLINGYSDTFKPNQVISRAEIAVILAKAAQLSHAETASPFTDVAGHWAANSINALAEQGIIQGRSAATFAPNANASREESVILILRILEKALDLDLAL